VKCEWCGNTVPEGRVRFCSDGHKSKNRKARAEGRRKHQECRRYDKVAYLSHAAASEVAAHLGEKRDAYYCPVHYGWHIGRHPHRFPKSGDPQ